MHPVTREMDQTTAAPKTSIYLGSIFFILASIAVISLSIVYLVKKLMKSRRPNKQRQRQKRQKRRQPSNRRQPSKRGRRSRR
ncbi:unnamed protein product [Caenorhabditis nigoni]